MMKYKWGIGGVMILLMCRCQSEPTLFEQLDASETGITFTNQLTETETANILAYEYFYNGGGVAVGDFNNDGLPDVYLTGNQVPNKLFLNRGNLKFEDKTQESGTAGREGAWKTGVTLADVNADGWLDIYVCYSGNFPAEKRKNQLFINLGKQQGGPLRFSEQAEAYGVADVGYSTQGLFFDYDTDGDLDLFVLNHNLRGYQRKEAAYLKKEFDPNAGDRLYRNDSPASPNGGHFTDVTREAGIISNALGFGLGVATGDLNGDNQPDLYVCNDYVEEDYAYLNNGDGTFSERGKEMMGHFSFSTMGVDIADVNNDALPDIFTTDMLPEGNRRQKLLSWPDNWNVQAAMLENGFHWQNMRNMLQVNQGVRHQKRPLLRSEVGKSEEVRFSEMGQLAGVQATDWSWAGLLADFDNDGRKDLFVSNGFVRDYTDLDFVKYYADEQMNGVGPKSKKSLLEHLKKMPATPTHHYIFKNETSLPQKGGIQFSNKVKEWGFERETIACGAAYADFDKDGDLDLITCNTNAPASLYKNEQQQQSPQHYLKIKLKGAGRNTLGVGAKVYVYAAGEEQYQEFTPTRGFQSCMYDDLHFGLGKVDKVDSVRVLWPGNRSQLLTAVAINRVLTVEEKNAEPFDPVRLLSKAEPLFEETNGPEFTHLENPSIDFNTQILLPYLYSYGGPRMARGDVNGDGLADIYVGGAANQPGQLYLQTVGKGFMPNRQPVFETDKAFEDRDAVFLDADGDKDLDLYVVSGEYEAEYSLFQDRLYLNDGKGKFTRSGMGQIPELTLNKSCVEAFDADLDGDLDLFLGGGVQPGNFPYANESFLLRNDGKGRFEIAEKWELGLVTDVAVADLNRDQSPEIIVCAEWKPVQVLERKQGKFTARSGEASGPAGLWSRIAAADLDADGDTDFVVGNWGLNTSLKITNELPLTLYFNDFDRNGRLDPFIAFANQGKSYPLAGRDEALEQLVPLRKIFTNYKSYSEVTAEEVLGKEWVAGANKLTVNELQTGVLVNDKGKLKFKPLPLAAQASPVFAIITGDFDRDGKTDILLAGNQSKFRIRIGKTDANQGLLLKGNGKGDFEVLPQYRSGLFLNGDIRDVQQIGNQLIFGMNDGKMQTYLLTSPPTF
ncbi:MAG: VCBS repeat-containing protein [Spirosomataceae bacterium]